MHRSPYIQGLWAIPLIFKLMNLFASSSGRDTATSIYLKYYSALQATSTGEHCVYLNKCDNILIGKISSGKIRMFSESTLVLNERPGNSLYDCVRMFWMSHPYMLRQLSLVSVLLMTKVASKRECRVLSNWLQQQKELKCYLFIIQWG